ncbi:hypothetical protein JIN84_06725 [Luteolibacter yonseiensis]|uniref:Uncharacterized protein n=1 Tax=Luteolibacter yonseiensis TaxID=1144680 RepID=A0A934R510_9BACT|nr:hypothetical protein [Luteolibacter yonseiensis]MBK1815299.1 hypothetical protein [Luteolibacter yonseiensis]
MPATLPDISAMPSPAYPASRRVPADQRVPSGPAVTRAYPWLLVTSTAVAALFCMMYITKPVIETAPSPKAVPAATEIQPFPPQETALLPRQNHLPGDAAASPAATAIRKAAPPTPPATAFEQTNLRIQHILTAETPGGHLAKIDLDVPVLYQSRNLRWTAAEVADARKLLARLADYQEKSRLLRTEGAELLDAWNRLIGNSIPAVDLRADSPSLPTNQQEAEDLPRAPGLDSSELIQIQPAKK